jgi:hypothetical protein
MQLHDTPSKYIGDLDDLQNRSGSPIYELDLCLAVMKLHIKYYNPGLFQDELSNEKKMVTDGRTALDKRR